MKKRIFGILLMGAMVVASMSMFTSCKDYDDDIQANKDDITALKTQLATLQTAAATAQSAADAAKSAADAAATAAKNAQTSADAAGTAAKNAQASADDAAKAASANATAIKAAQDAIKALEDQVAAFAKVEELNAVKADLEKAIADATAGKVSAEELTEALKPISAKIDAIDESLNSLTADVEALKGWKATVEGQIAAVQQDLKNQAEAIKALQEEIKKKIEAGDLAGLTDDTAIKAYIDEKLKAYATSAEVSTAIANALKNYTTTADLKKMLEGYSTPAAVQTAITSTLQDYYTAAKTNELISGLNTAITNAQTAVASAQTEAQVRAIAQSAAEAVSADLGEKINILNVLVSKHLTSLVFRPSFMMNGIETDVLPALVNPNIYKINANAGKIDVADPTKSESWKAPVATASLSKYLNGAVYYHFNPSTADLTGYNISFYNNEPATRAIGVNTNLAPAKNTISNDDKTQDGLLKVDINNSKNVYDNLRRIIVAGRLPMVALEATKGDTVVTSDYAYIHPTNYNNLVLGDAIPVYAPIVCAWSGATPVMGELTMNPNFHANAGVMRAHPVMYNEEIDLNTLVETHYDDDINNPVTGAWTTIHRKMSQAILDELGLSYKFKAMDWTLGTETTSQSVHLHVEADGKAWPVEVDNTGKVIDATKVNQKKGAVGRLPIVRVTLEDAAGNIYAYGYLKLQIVEEIVEPTINEVSVSYAANKIWYANCADGTNSLTWSEVEAKVLNALNISHNSFMNYAPWSYWDAVRAKSFMTQYVKKDDGTYEDVNTYNWNLINSIQTANFALPAAKQKKGAALVQEFYRNGGVGFTADADNDGYFDNTPQGWGHVYANMAWTDPRTSLFEWTLTSDDYTALSNSVLDFINTTNGKSKKALSTYVKMTNGTATEVYIDMTIPVTQIQFAAGNLGKHIPNKWYAAAAETEGTEEIHANVEVPTADPATGTITDFEYNILTTFQEGKIGIDGVDTRAGKPFANFAAYLNSGKFYFDEGKYNKIGSATAVPKVTATGMDGTVYGLYINAAATRLYAEPLITTAPDKGKITFAGGTPIAFVSDGDEYRQEKVTLVMNPVTKNLLNLAPHTDLANTLATYMKVKFDNTLAGCYVPFVNGTDEFVVRYLRPINAKRGGDETAVDAVDGGSNINILKMIKLDDWRDYGITYADAVASSKKQHDSYITYYGIRLEFDPAQIRTDEGLADAQRVKLDDAAKIAALPKATVIDPNIVLTPAAGTITLNPVWTPATATTAGHWSAAGNEILNYKNAQTGARKFHLYVPIKVKYNYGELPTVWGVVVVNGTVQNARQK